MAQEPIVESGVGTLADFLGQTTPIEDTAPQTSVEDMFSTPQSEEEQPKEETPTAEVEDLNTPPAEEPKEIPTPPTTASSVQLADLIKDYIEEGDWEDVILDINGEQVQLSTLENVDRKTFLDIRKAQKQLQEEKNKEKFVSVEGLDETTKRLIELKKKGGDIIELLQKTEQFQNPLEGLDLDDERTQVDLVYGKLMSQGWEHEDAINKIARLQKEFKLDTTAKTIADEVTVAYQNAKETELKKEEEKLQKQAEAEKERRKNLQELYKGLSTQGANLPENKIRSLVDNATKKDAQGKTNFDKLIEEAKSNPEKLAEINFFLNDPKGYMEFKTAKVKNETALKTIKIISTVDKTSKSAPTQEKDEDTANKWERLFSPQT